MPDTKTIVHIIDRLVIGGMENGIVNIVNGTSDYFQHKIVCLRYCDQDFQCRIRAPNLEVIALKKKSGKNPSYYRDLYRILRAHKPAIVHTRNLPTIDLPPIIRAAGIKYHIHGEHGWDVLEKDGSNRKYNFMRYLLSPLVDRYVCVSKDIAHWLTGRVGVATQKVAQIYNGVDANKFSPQVSRAKHSIPIVETGDIVIGTVGRMEEVKDQMTLVEAFVRLASQYDVGRERLKLVIVGEGTFRLSAVKLLEEAGLANQAWLPGACDNVADIMKDLTVFVLPSVNEGISNTILEAMATGLPVVATAVGGNKELVVPNVTGILVPPKDPIAMCEALLRYASQEIDAKQHGSAARSLAVEKFSLAEMISQYTKLYQSAYR